MADYIVALSIDKVQTLLYEVINSHVQEKQTETGTLRQIKNASREISNRFFDEIRKAFSSFDTRVLLKCSGVVIFQCGGATEEGLDEQLNQLFLKYYKESQGQKILKYTYFMAEGRSKIENIQKAKKNLKNSKYTSKIIEQNKEELFRFQKVSNKQDKRQDPSDKWGLFVGGVNELYPYDTKNKKNPYKDNHFSNDMQNKENPYEENHFPIAVIKADLSGMGNMFASITDYDEYQQISNILNEHISLDGLHKAAKRKWGDKHDAWILPFYVAGDDIFFAVSVTNLFKGIDVCREMINTINKKIKKFSKNTHLTMDIGVAVTFNKQPIRYYIELVEGQLKKAKKAECPKELKKLEKELKKEFLKATIAINNQIFFDVDYGEMKEEKKGADKKNRTDMNRVLANMPVWCFFQKDVKDLQILNLNEEVTKQICSTSFLYSLLERLSNIDLCGENNREKEVEYMNTLLYGLRLKYLDDPELRNKELLIKGRIIRQLYVKKIKDRDKKIEGGDTIELNEKSKRRLETYIRLLILLTDPRFNLDHIGKNCTMECNQVDLENMHKYLLKKPVKYLYNTLNNYDQSLLNTIIRRNTYATRNNKGDRIYVPYYKRVNIEKSMFFKLRDTDKVPVEKAGKMIELKNPDSNDEIYEKNKPRIEEEKAPYHLYFDKDRFIKQAKARNSWNTNFIDALMLLYEYNEMDIKLKGIKNGGVEDATKN